MDKNTRSVNVNTGAETYNSLFNLKSPLMPSIKNIEMGRAQRHTIACDRPKSIPKLFRQFQNGSDKNTCKGPKLLTNANGR